MNPAARAAFAHFLATKRGFIIGTHTWADWQAAEAAYHAACNAQHDAAAEGSAVGTK